MGYRISAILVLFVLAGPSIADPSPGPDPGPDPGCVTCYPKTDFGYPDLLYTLLIVIALVLALPFGIVSLIFTLLCTILGPASDTTTLLGAFNGPTTFEGFLGSLPIVLKYLNLVNVPTAVLG